MLRKRLDKEIISKTKAIEIVKQVEQNDFKLSDGLKALIYNFNS